MCMRLISMSADDERRRRCLAKVHAAFRVSMWTCVLRNYTHTHTPVKCNERPRCILRSHEPRLIRSLPCKFSLIYYGSGTADRYPHFIFAICRSASEYFPLESIGDQRDTYLQKSTRTGTATSSNISAFIFTAFSSIFFFLFAFIRRK